MDLADREGLGALTMRRLGAELGVEAMSLYKHVANKEAILDGVVELIVAQIEIPEPGPSLEAGHAVDGPSRRAGSSPPTRGRSGCWRPVARWGPRRCATWTRSWGT